MSRLYKSTSAESGSSEDGSLDDLSNDLRTDLGDVLSVILGYASAPVGTLTEGTDDFLRGIFLSDGDIIQKLACGLYAGSTSAEYQTYIGFLGGAETGMNIGDWHFVSL